MLIRLWRSRRETGELAEPCIADSSAFFAAFTRLEPSGILEVHLPGEYGGTGYTTMRELARVDARVPLTADEMFMFLKGGKMWFQGDLDEGSQDGDNT